MTEVSMVERVARACETYLHQRADFAAPINYSDLARAAILAMRTPTDGMLAATGLEEDLLIKQAWEAMVDEAVK